MPQPRGHGRSPKTRELPVRSIRPFKSSEQYLEAMKEDLAEWLRDLYGLEIDAVNFLQELETGLVLCRHANTVTEAALALLVEGPTWAQRLPMPRVGVSCNSAAQPGTFQARDNISNFIQWCRMEMGIQEALMFETEDLVLRKNVKNVVLCLLELGRRAWRFGVPAPTLVQLEEEIDQELRRELALAPSAPPPPAPPTRQPCHFRNLDQMVQSLVSHCTCPVQFPMVKVSEGKYRVGDSNTLIFIRILRNHVMVRVGGGWDTLGHYLDKHDPCRCTSLSHKPSSFQKPPAPPAQHEVRVQDGPRMTISRSQSPPPPVTWKTYTSSGRKRRPLAAASPGPCGERGAGVEVLGEMAPPPRCQEKLLTPAWRQLPAGYSPPSPGSSSSHRGRDPQCTPSGKREDGLPHQSSRGRTPTSWVYEDTNRWGSHARASTPQRFQGAEATAKGIPTRGPSPLPCSTSPVKPLGLRQLSWGEANSASPQPREPASGSSPSPVKGLTKIPIQLPSSRPPTPGSSPGTASKDLTAESGRGSAPLGAVIGYRCPNRSRHRDGTAEGEQEGQKLDIRVPAKTGEPRSLGLQEPEGRYSPLPLGRNKEQAVYHSLEVEIVANMKLLEVGVSRPQGTGSGAIPRSGVYIPLGGQWPKRGGPYDKVIQELTQGPPPLLKVNLEAWRTGPTGSPKLAAATVSGRSTEKLGAREDMPRTKISLCTKDPRIRKVTPQGGQDCSASTVSDSLEAPTPSSLNLNSDKARACQGKGKRSLRKPQKVPSIYKLKLRPRIRPRRDHRPEKRPSRIPRPMAYLCLAPSMAPPRGKVEQAALGSKEGEAFLVDGEKEEGKEKKGPATPLESSPQPSEGLRPQQLDQAPLPPEEESWV
ncbi:GAS2-like protein 2 [Tamandua tetradactyla]|uniref:GAS2-like protein 2 n=1 Tax=Tamandua tetradactyla TaxID=48850 RepID=UPI0040539250